jgi:hypothetical protein
VQASYAMCPPAPTPPLPAALSLLAAAPPAQVAPWLGPLLFGGPSLLQPLKP